MNQYYEAIVKHGLDVCHGKHGWRVIKSNPETYSDWQEDLSVAISQCISRIYEQTGH